MKNRILVLLIFFACHVSISAQNTPEYDQQYQSLTKDLVSLETKLASVLVSELASQIGELEQIENKVRSLQSELMNWYAAKDRICQDRFFVNACREEAKQQRRDIQDRFIKIKVEANLRSRLLQAQLDDEKRNRDRK